MNIEVISVVESEKAGLVTESHCYHSHFLDDDKAYLVIGGKASNEQLERASKKLGLLLTDLIEFRDSLIQ